MVSAQKINPNHAYLFALVLIAGSMISAYVLVTHKVSTSMDNASVVNTAGMQRMLSQRLGLLSGELLRAESTQVKAKLLHDYESALKRFSDNHESLHALTLLDSTSNTIKALYAGDSGVDSRSRQFIALAENILDEADSEGRAGSHQQSLSLQLVSIARNGFVAELDGVVQEYDRQASQAVDDFKQLELAILCTGLLLLLFEALFIFRPIVNTSAMRQKKLEKSNRELMEFSFRISHDLRAPVASSRGMIEIAREAIDDNDPQMVVDVLGRMNVLLLRLETLIEDIIAVTRNNTADTEPEPVNLQAVVAKTMEELSAMPGYQQCQFDVDIDTDTIIYTKKLYLQQVVQNLISNAIKYSDHDKDVSRISIAAKLSGNECELLVDDNGIGIPENCRQKVFDMFMRFHPGVSHGSGLGLYLTYQNAVALGGKLHYEPLENGSRFALTFQPDRA